MRTRGHGLWRHRLWSWGIGGLRSLRGHRLLVGPHLWCLRLMEVPVVGIVQRLRPILRGHLLGRLLGGGIVIVILVRSVLWADVIIAEVLRRHLGRRTCQLVRIRP